MLQELEFRNCGKETELMGLSDSRSSQSRIVCLLRNSAGVNAELCCDWGVRT